MKKNFFMSIILICIGICAAVVCYLKYANTSHKHSDYRVAIFEPAFHPSMDDIAQGFTDTVDRNGTRSYTFTRYNANGNPTLLRSQAEEIIYQNYDLVMSIGTNTTKTLYELTTKKQLTTPIVFTAIADPVKNGITTSLDFSGNHVTGVRDVPNYHQQIDQLLGVKPSTQHVLLVYDAAAKGGEHEAEAHYIADYFRTKNIQTSHAKVFQTNEISTKVQPLLSDVDVIMILTDHTVVAGVDSLISLCNRYGVTLFTSELNSADKGAALSYGVIEYDYGVKAAQQALAILEDKKSPQEIPIVILDTCKLKVNTNTMHKQGLQLSQEQIDTIKNNGGIML